MTIFFQVLSWKFTRLRLLMRPLLGHCLKESEPLHFRTWSLSIAMSTVDRGTYGKTLPLIHRHPDAIVILWNKGDHDHVFSLRCRSSFRV